jgi:Winged helix DNA-binding domain
MTPAGNCSTCPAVPGQIPARLLRPGSCPNTTTCSCSYADRSRIVTGNRRIPLPPGNGGARGTLLVDGFFKGTWHATRSAGKVTLRISTFGRLSGPDHHAVAGEGMQLLGFIAPRSEPDVILVPEQAS